MLADDQLTGDPLPEYPMRRNAPFDPPPELKAIQEGERVVRVKIWDGSTPWLVTGFEESRAVLADARISVDTGLDGYPHNSSGTRARRLAGKSFIDMDNPEHAVLRRMLARDFSAHRVETLRPHIQDITDRLVGDLLAGPNPTDLIDAFALPLPSLIICDLLGVPYADRELFQSLSRTLMSAHGEANLQVSALQEMLQFFYDLIAQKESQPGNDLLSRLVKNELRPGRISSENLAMVLQLLLVAGHETTTNMIALSVAALLSRPDLLEVIRSDKKTVAPAVEELLRWLTVTHLGRRRVAMEDITVGGKRIAAGEGIIVATDIADRDPGKFTEPDDLNTSRAAWPHLAFGWGVHMCLGAPLARVELDVAFEILFRRIPNLQPASPLHELHFKHDSIIYGIEELPVRW